MVRYWDEEQKREFVFLTNQTHISSLQVAELYKNRWQVELFFKWLKQHLKIKKFWGTTENAVRIQIYAAICSYCLVAIVQKYMKLDRTTYEVLQILSISLTGFGKITLSKSHSLAVSPSGFGISAYVQFQMCRPGSRLVFAEAEEELQTLCHIPCNAR